VERFDPEAVGEEKLERRIRMACGLQCQLPLLNLSASRGFLFRFPKVHIDLSGVLITPMFSAWLYKQYLKLVKIHKD